MEFLDCYIRVSGAEQKSDGNSLVVQEDMAHKVAKKLKLKCRIRNEGARSSTIQYRRVLEEEIKYGIRNKEIKYIWVQDRSRMFRDLTDALVFQRDYLIRHKVNLYQGEAGTKMSFDSAEENFMSNVLSAATQYENENRRNKSIAGKLYKLRNDANTKSVFLGGTALFGYESIDKVWHIKKSEAEIVRYIFDAYENGKSVKQIKQYLDNKGIKARRSASGLWVMQTLFTMLRNKSYTGLHEVYMKRAEETFTYKIPAIIKVAQFNRIQKKLDAVLLEKTNNKQHYSLLEDLLKCECGRSYGSRHLKSTSSLGYKVNTRTYYCKSKMYSWKSGVDEECRNKKSLNMDALNEYVLNYVKDKVSKSALLKERFKSEVLEEKNEQTKNSKEIEKKLQKRAIELQGEIERIEDNIVELEVSKGLGKQDTKLVDKIIQRYGVELENTKTSYENIEEELAELDNKNQWIDWISKYSDNIKISTSNEEKQKEFLHGILNKIIVSSTHALDRNEKEVQVGHRLKFEFKLKIVDDKHEWIEEDNKKKSKITEGKKISYSEDAIRFITKRTRSKKKR